jgi:hypothetical protein
MATRTNPKAKSARRRPGSEEARKAFDKSMERVTRSIDAAEVAAKDLRSGVTKGSRDLVRDLERTLHHARTNAHKVGNAVSEDIEQAMRADGGGGPTRQTRRSPRRT